jgi:hypothetical protein
MAILGYPFSAEGLKFSHSPKKNTNNCILNNCAWEKTQKYREKPGRKWEKGRFFGLVNQILPFFS